MENEEKQQRSRWKVTMSSFWAEELTQFALANPVYGITIKTLESENYYSKIELNFRKDIKSLQHQAIVHFMLAFGMNMHTPSKNPKSQDDE